MEELIHYQDPPGTKITTVELDEDDKEFVTQKFNLGKVFKSDGFIIIVTALVVAVVAKTAIDGLYSVGVQQGYAPTQPIAYSHKLIELNLYLYYIVWIYNFH